MKSTIELKFLLTLLSFAGYRSPATSLNFKGKAQLCRDLGERGWIDYSKEIASVRLLPPGQALLALDPSSLPIDGQDLQVLRKIDRKSGRVTLTDITVSKRYKTDKQAVLRSLADRGFVELDLQMQRAKGEVWLTPEGETYLREDYHPKGTASISLNLLGHYVTLLRNISVLDHESKLAQPASALDDLAIVNLIQVLDQELGQDNYLPLFHLRQRLSKIGSMPRQDLDQALYRLQRSDKIELSALQETDAYSAEQIESGIPQALGGPLFFISLVEG